MTSPAPERDARSSEEAESDRMAKETPTEEPAPSNHGYQQDPTLSQDKTDREKKQQQQEKKPSIFKRAWIKLDLDMGTLMTMGKAALPPTIALAMYQANDVAETYTTLGYLAAIMSILGFCIMPRAKFIQTMTMNILATCIGSAFAMLMVWSGVKARQNTTAAGAPHSSYNSSQSAVLGVWLFFLIYAINALKAKFPQMAFPSIIFSILINVAATNGTVFQTVATCESFIRRLLEAFLTGFAIATGVALFILPMTCRKVVMKEFTGYIGLLRASLGANRAYIHSLENSDMYGQGNVPRDGEHANNTDGKAKMKPEVAAFRGVTGAIQGLHGKVAADLPFAKREVAYGKLTPDDLETIFKHLRTILLPILGLGSVVDLFERTAEDYHWDGNENAHDKQLREESVREWNDMFTFVREPLDHIIQALDDGLAHVMLKLQLGPQPKGKNGQHQHDSEAKGDSVQPGDAGFADHLQKQADIFFNQKESTLCHWVETKGIKLGDDYFSGSSGLRETQVNISASITTSKRDQRELFMVLYVMFLLNATSRAILEFVKFADEHDQATAKSKLIWPGGRRIKKWVKSLVQDQDANSEDETTVAGFNRNNATVYMGEAFKERKDPEHLPPANTWERFGNNVRSASHFLRSDESVFGFRAACATMSIAVVAFLHTSQNFFIEQRLVWALIMVAISMTPTAGQSIFQFILRILGTAIAMIVAWLIWYIPGHKTPGILVFLWLFLAIGFYIPLKRMDLVIVGMISIVTATLIIGYELQVRKIGTKAATASTGQPAYPIYELGPYRLATVVGGLAVAFFWTVFPYPITEHSALRQKLGGALYLSANLYSIMHEQVLGRIRGELGGDEEDEKDSPGFQLVKARNKVFAKQMLTMQGLKQHANFVKWEFPLGGKFPKEEYEKIVGYLENIVNYTALLGYASQAFTDPSLNPQSADPSSPGKQSSALPMRASTQWFNDFRRVISSASVSSHEITSLLALLSSSITNAQPLPPYLHAPTHAHLNRQLESIDPEILSLKHIAEPGYAAFAVMSVCTRCITMDTERLLDRVKALVGELDFSFHVVSTKEASGDPLVKRSRTRTGLGGKKRD